MQHAPIDNASRERAHQFGVGNASEVVREVGVYDFRVASKQQLFHLDHRLLGISPRTVGVLLGWKIGFEDRFEHEQRCTHAHPITQGRDAQRSKLAIGLRDKHASNRVRSVRLLPKRKRQFTEPPFHSVRLDIRKLLTIHTRSALVRAALRVGMHENVVAADLVVQGVEAIARLCLRFRVQRRLQLLNTLRSC